MADLTAAARGIWWLVLLRGILAILFGLFALFAPGTALLALVFVFAAYAILDGVTALLVGIRHRKDEPHWGWHVVQGVVSVLAGVIAFVWPGVTVLAILFVIAFWSIVGGIAEVVESFMMRKRGSESWGWMLAAGVVSVLFGIVLLAWPGAALITLLWLVGVYAIVFGVIIVVWAVRLRRAVGAAVKGYAVVPDPAVVFWMLVAFVVTFAVTRVITNLIRRGRGPFRDMSVGGVHIHHQVWGIFLLLGVGTVELAYRPGHPWLEVLAVMFGMGAALTLDEFALWLRLDDVYWGPEGRRSVDAVLLATLVGLLMLVGLSPFEDDASDGEFALGITIAINLLFVLAAVLKGRIVLGVLGLFVPIVAFVATCRLARPRSPWARRFYREGSRRLARSRNRFPEGRRMRWDPLVDLLAGRLPKDTEDATR